ncbi:MAG: hypothetical protein Q9182_005314 [Xanthomendoza sp. 2 TL-2023]
MGSLRFSEYTDSPTMLLPPPNIHSFYASAHSHCIPHHQPVTQSTSQLPPTQSSASLPSSRKRSREGDAADAAAAHSNPKSLRTSSASARQPPDSDSLEGAADRSTDARGSMSNQYAGLNLARPIVPKSSGTERDQDVEMTVASTDDISLSSARGTEVSAVQGFSAVIPVADEESLPTLGENSFDDIANAPTISQPASHPSEKPPRMDNNTPFDDGLGSTANNYDVTMS